MLRKFLVFLIKAYQKYISPYKGFRCAHRVLRGGVSCSAYGLEQFTSKSLAEAYSLTLQRTRECKSAYEDYLSRQPQSVRKALQKRRKMLIVRLIHPKVCCRVLKGLLINSWPKRQKGETL